MGLRGPDLLSGAHADRLVHAELPLQPGGEHVHAHEHSLYGLGLEEGRQDYVHVRSHERSLLEDVPPVHNVLTLLVE